MRHAIGSLLLVWCSSAIGVDTRHAYVPPAGFVPDAKTAGAIATAVLVPIYGDEAVRRQRPYRAELTDGKVWLVTGTLATGNLGGTVSAAISKQTGEIIRITHEKQVGPRRADPRLFPQAAQPRSTPRITNYFRD